MPSAVNQGGSLKPCCLGSMLGIVTSACNAFTTDFNTAQNDTGSGWANAPDIHRIAQGSHKPLVSQVQGSTKLHHLHQTRQSCQRVFKGSEVSLWELQGSVPKTRKEPHRYLTLGLWPSKLQEKKILVFSLTRFGAHSLLQL